MITVTVLSYFDLYVFTFPVDYDIYRTLIPIPNWDLLAISMMENPLSFSSNIYDPTTSTF